MASARHCVLEAINWDLTALGMPQALLIVWVRWMPLSLSVRFVYSIALRGAAHSFFRSTEFNLAPRVRASNPHAKIYVSTPTRGLPNLLEWFSVRPAARVPTKKYVGD